MHADGNYYDSIAEGYEELHKEEQLKKIAIIKQHFSPSPKERLLDVGCGSGITTGPWGCQRYGIDPSRELIRKAVAKDKGIKYLIAAAENIPFPNGFFDHVISITAIQNFDDIEKGLQEIKRVGKYSFVLTFLKKSKKKEMIEKLIKKHFTISKIIEEEKDMVYFCS